MQSGRLAPLPVLRDARSMREVYLDWASAAPVSARAKRAFDAVSKEFGNPSSPHAFGVRANRILEDARHHIARIAGVKQDGVIFTSGATEANNFAIQGHLQALHKKGRAYNDMHVLYLPTMHASVIETMHALEGQGIQIEPFALKDGAIDLAHLSKQIRSQTVLVSVDVICGETGTRWATRDVRRTLDAARTAKVVSFRVLLHVDASQAPFVESIEHTHLGADLITLDAQKVGGIRGIGALIRSNAGIPLAPLICGGGQEYGLRPGTESPALAAAFATALDEALSHEKENNLRQLLIDTLSIAFPNILINVGKESSPNILNVSFPKLDTDYAVMLLSEKGFAVSTKSACETNEEGSRAVQILFNDAERARSTLRISWGPTTRVEDIRKCGKELAKVMQFLQSTRLQ
jgi:cysteine desulfurase